MWLRNYLLHFQLILTCFTFNDKIKYLYQIYYTTKLKPVTFSTVASSFQGIQLKSTLVTAGWLKWDFCVRSHKSGLAPLRPTLWRLRREPCSAYWAHSRLVLQFSGLNPWNDLYYYLVIIFIVIGRAHLARILIFRLWPRNEPKTRF